MPRNSSSMPISFNGRARRPPQPSPEPEAELPEPDIDQLDDVDNETDDYFAEADALAAMAPEDFYRLLRTQVEKVKTGEIPAGLEVVHPGPKDRPRGKRYKRRDKHGRAF